MIKIVKLAVLAVMSIVIISGCKTDEAGAGNEVTQYAGLEYAGLECVVVEEKDPDKIMKIFREMQAEGREMGYTPLIVLRDEWPGDERSVLDECLELSAEDYGSLEAYTTWLLDEYQTIDAENYFNENSKFYLEYAEWEQGAGMEYIGDLGEAESQDDLYISFIEDIYIAKVPTDKPYEVLAYIPIGGFNDCPANEDHLAIAKQWYEEYGAVPCAVSYDIVQYYLETPVTDEAALEKLKREQYIYCYDIVDQGVGSLENLARSLDGSKFWFFWWD